MQALNDLWSGACARGASQSGGDRRGDVAPGPLNVDALGKAYIVERTVAMARQLVPAGLLDVGGDIRVWGDVPWTIGIADPMNPAENAPLLGSFALRGSGGDQWLVRAGWQLRQALVARAESADGSARRGGSKARRWWRPTASPPVASTKRSSHQQRRGSGRGATGKATGWLLVDGIGQLCSGGVLQEAAAAPATAATLWPKGFEVSVELGLKNRFSRRHQQHRPYVCVWVEDAEGKAVRTVALWGEERGLPSRHALLVEGDRWQFEHRFTRGHAPPRPGKYTVSWDGLDDAGKACREAPTPSTWRSTARRAGTSRLDEDHLWR